jgi:hypothetical protein
VYKRVQTVIKRERVKDKFVGVLNPYFSISFFLSFSILLSITLSLSLSLERCYLCTLADITPLPPLPLAPFIFPFLLSLAFLYTIPFHSPIPLWSSPRPFHTLTFNPSLKSSVGICRQVVNCRQMKLVSAL